VKSVLSFLGQRRKAIAAVLGLGSELIAQAIPQTNSQNALVLHSVLAAITVFMVHATPNDAPTDSISEFVDDLVKGDGGAHSAPPVVSPLPQG
jgi:hypothetical protein